MVDDVYLNGYAKHLGPITSMVYISLCRHVDKDQYAFPSQELIAEEIKAGVRSVKNAIALLKEWNLIDIERIRSDRKWARNSYYLLDKAMWKKVSSAPSARDVSGANDDKDQGHVLHTKDTHKKDTHIITKVITKPNGFGNPDINLLVSYLQEKMELPRLDLSEKINRQYAHLLLNRSKKGVDGVKWLIDIASKDGWYKSHITSFKDLWNNQVKIVSSTRGEVLGNDRKRGVDASSL